nr:MAG TPA: hypothetical protein [Caudoviricetes sp.]
MPLFFCVSMFTCLHVKKFLTYKTNLFILKVQKRK